MSLYMQAGNEMVDIASGGGSNSPRLVNLYNSEREVAGYAFVFESNGVYAIWPIATRNSIGYRAWVLGSDFPLYNYEQDGDRINYVLQDGTVGNVNGIYTYSDGFFSIGASAIGQYFINAKKITFPTAN